MKSPRHRLGAALIFGGTAALFLLMDLRGISYRGDGPAFSAVIAQVVALTVIVGSLIYAMTFLEKEEEEAPGRRAAAPPAGDELLGEGDVAVFIERRLRWTRRVERGSSRTGAP